MDIALPRTALTDGTLTWASSETAAGAVYLGSTADTHGGGDASSVVPVRWVFLDKHAAAQLRSAALGGHPLVVGLHRVVPDKTVKKGAAGAVAAVAAAAAAAAAAAPELVPDAATACVASFRLDGAAADGGGGSSSGGGGGGVQDSLLDEGATAIAAAVPLRPAVPPPGHHHPTTTANNSKAAPNNVVAVVVHPVVAAKSAAFLALKLSAPLSASHGARVGGGLNVAALLNNNNKNNNDEDDDDDDGGGGAKKKKKKKKFSAVHDSEEVLRAYLRETARVLLAEHGVQFAASSTHRGDASPLPPVEEQRRRVREGLSANGFGVLVADNLKCVARGACACVTRMRRWWCCC